MSRPVLDFSGGAPRSHEFQDDYYSPTDGLAESQYVYLEGGNVIERIKALRYGETLTILELGIGTALNLALLMNAWSLHAPFGARFHYLGIEKHPLSRSQLTELNARWETLADINEVIASRWPAPLHGCHRREEMIKDFTADFWWGDAGEVLSDLASHQTAWVDVWFLDGFTPARNASMWSDAVILHMQPLSNFGAEVATFTAASRVRRALENAGFAVTKRPGFGRKRECMKARLTTDARRAEYPALTAWDQPEKCPKPKNCLVIGAGLAGAHVARKLADEGCHVTLLESRQLAAGGSSQPQGVIYTRPSHKHGKLSDFSLAAYCFSTDHHKQLFAKKRLIEGLDGEMTGYIQLSDRAKLDRLVTPFDDEESPVKIVTAEEASTIAGIPLERGGLYFPDSGWLNPAGVCRGLIDHEKIRLIEGVGVVKTRQISTGTWSAENAQGQTIAIGDSVVITTAWQATESPELNFLPLQPIRGQTTQLDSTGALSNMQCTVCHDGYTPPARHGQHCIGATYGLNETSTEEREEDHERNMAQLAANLPSLSDSLPPKTANNYAPKGIAAVRCATNDYLPIVGSVPDQDAFNRTYDGLRHDRKRKIAAQQPNIEGLWVLTGLGSRGLTSAPLLSEALVSTMFQRPPPLPRYLLQAVSPARFLRRNLVKGGS